MGSELVEDFTPQNESELEVALFSTYSEQFENVFPYYMSLGMTYDEFWNKDCQLVKYYRKAQEIRDKRRNQELWLQGMYIYEALLNASPILHAFAKNGTKPKPYPKEPYAITEKEARERREKEELARVNQMRERLMKMAKQKE